MKKNQTGFFGIGLFLVLVVFAAIILVGLLVVIKTDGNGTNHDTTINRSYSQVHYNLPTREITFTPDTFLQESQAETKVVNDSIHIVYTSPRSTKTYKINTTDNGLTVVNSNGTATRTITINIVKNFQLGTELNQGLDISVGNQFTYGGETIGKVADITHGYYTVKINVSDETGKVLDRLSSSVEYR